MPVFFRHICFFRKFAKTRNPGVTVRELLLYNCCFQFSDFTEFIFNFPLYAQIHDFTTLFTAAASGEETQHLTCSVRMCMSECTMPMTDEDCPSEGNAVHYAYTVTGA